MVTLTIPAARDADSSREVDVGNLKGVLRAYGDGNLFGEPYGDGPPHVVWLHGWGRRSQDFQAAASELAASGFASVALDLPGFGSSPPPVRTGGARLYADLLAGPIAQMSDAPLVLVGHSFGGRVATVLAAQHPELVRAVVLTGTPLLRRSSASTSPWRYRLIRWLRVRGLVGEARLEAARQRFGSADYRAAAGVMRDVLVATVNESYEAELADVTVPVTMVWGEWDRDVPVDVARRARELLHSTSSLRVVAGVGHLLPTEAPHELVDSVREALS
jgi:pimeloyl-ACP methyl ester carboxylesterase